MYLLRREQFIARPPAEVFRFFQNPVNLGRITPPGLRFELLTPEPILMREGVLLDFLVRPLGFPQRWTSIITEYRPPDMFTDQQLAGPYSFWRHRHIYDEKPGGTLMTDEIHYLLPWGPLGRLANGLFVRRQLESIFNFRADRVTKLMDCNE